MADAWIYGPAAGELEQWLAEAGWAARPITGAALVPAGARCPPALAIVVAPTGEEPPNELCAALAGRAELAGVPVLLAVEPEQLDRFSELEHVHELLVRPFSAEELRVRVARAQRELRRGASAGVVRSGPLLLDPATRQASLDGAAIALTYMEYALLDFLVTRPRRVYSREALLRLVWGYDYYGGARTVDVHVRRLRAKLGDRGGWIRTVRNSGYVFDTAPVDETRA